MPVWRRRGRVFFPCVAAVGLLPLAVGAQTVVQPVLTCGVPVSRFLSAGAVDRYQFSVPEGVKVLIQSSDASGSIGLLRLRTSGSGNDAETCTGVLEFESHGGESVLEVSDCRGTDSGTYTVTLSVISEDENAPACGFSLSCGATPDGIGLNIKGEVDSFTFLGKEDEHVTLVLASANAAGLTGGLRLRLYDPEGELVPDGDSCARSLTVRLPRTGRYTALVSACGLPHAGLYRLIFDAPRCPDGPVITYFGIADAEVSPLWPNLFDDKGRPVYTRHQGQGMFVVIEARPGSNRRAVGLTTVSDGLPDLQMLVSRSLGDGNPAICDIDKPLLGGVPGVESLEFSDRQAVVNAVNDLGCRFDDGQKNHAGRPISIEACTRSQQAFGFAFVDPITTVQFCAQIAEPWAFPRGDTVVVARVRDDSGVVGARREIVVRIIGDATPTPTRTRTPTLLGGTATPTRTASATRIRTPTVTRSPVATRTGGAEECAGDCNHDRRVTIDELLLAVRLARAGTAAGECERADVDKDGTVSINELVRAVTNALRGCR